MERKGLIGTESGLSDEEKQGLLRLARMTLEKRLLGKTAAVLEMPDSTVLKEKRGAFVSLHRRGMLRGCIGCIEGRKPLLGTIEEMAGAAAFSDPRFPPLSAEELKDLDIEISVLTPLKEISDINEIQIGMHGLFIERQHYCGLLLPQVATEWGWDRIRFLEESCRKAGLPSSSWKEKGTKIYIFSADVFSSSPK
jgi:AmmeMemoRadiSam system protein A